MIQSRDIPNENLEVVSEMSKDYRIISPTNFTISNIGPRFQILLSIETVDRVTMHEHVRLGRVDGPNTSRLSVVDEALLAMDLDSFLRFSTLVENYAKVIREQVVADHKAIGAVLEKPEWGITRDGA